MKEIEPKSFVLKIKEYGKEVRSYNDTNYGRFKRVSNEIIMDHLDKYSKQNADEVKNIQFDMYTY